MKKNLIAEAIGTMVLVLMGCGSAVFNGGAVSVAAVLTIAFAFGFSVVAMAYAIGHISGCHINPAVTLGVFLAGRMSGKEAAAYMVAQVAGAFVGSGILYCIASNMGVEGTGANQYAEGQLLSALVAEFVFTSIFVFTVLGATSRSNHASNWAGLAIGLCLVLVHIVCIPITGTSVNPARSIAPAVFAGGLPLLQLWVFIVAPLAGAVLAAMAWRMLRK
ncbi:MIP family channel protein [Bacteroides hominis]|uniref:MIP family channel protein n=1 Tax=Bacteroides thetaiotaomicron TaxID=818 RepID=UPI002273A09B|nr:MIP family channel protein [Bacteroides fragilis]